MIRKELLEILACPVDKGDIVYDEENDKLICQKCGRRYPGSGTRQSSRVY